MDTDSIVRKIKENQKIAIAVGAIVVLIILILLISFGKKNSAVPVQGPVDIVGKFSCLPYSSTATSTTGCTLGVKDGKNYYAMDVSTITLAVTDLEADDDIEVKGDFVPIEMISSDQFKSYDIAGIIKVDSLTRAK